jgi:peptidoglycan/LPS O-acetylase OafA/YrhL
MSPDELGAVLRIRVQRCHVDHEQLVGVAIPEHPNEAAVDGEERTVGRGPVDPVRRVLDQLAVLLFGAPEGTGWLYIETLWEPFGTLWFIYLLPIFFVVAKLAHSFRVPAIAVWLVGAALEIAHIHTGFTVIDEFASRFVYFYTGYLFAPRIFALAARWREFPEAVLAGLAVWGLVNALLVIHGYAEWPLVSLALGLAGAAAVVAVSVLLSRTDLAAPLRYCGRNSLVIYLAFFLPMAVSRTVVLKTGLITDIGTVSALVTLAGVVGALLMYWVVRHTFLRFLFERPERFWIAPKQRMTLRTAPQAAP